MVKQSDYLAGLLTGDEAGNAEAPAPRQRGEGRGLTLLARETALARVASGELRQVTQLAIDPARVRVWSGNARAYDRLTEASCRELIDSLIAEGGQRVPAVVRRVEGDAVHEYEVIAGTRRHWAISWLRANNYPDMLFLAQVERLDDEAAFRLADIENRARRDVSDIERARNYAGALASHYGGKQARMAERLNISRGWLSKMIAVAAVPDTVLAAFADLDGVSLAGLYPLARAMDDKGFAKRAIATAQIIAREQAALAASGDTPLPAPVVVRLLMEANERPSAAPPPPYTAASRHGRTMLSVTAAGRQGVTIRLHSGSGATRQELVAAVEGALAALDEAGQGVQP